MKRVFVGLVFVVLGIAVPANAYTIGGAYASLQKCEWGQWGYQYGYIGTYRVGFGTSAQYYKIYFGSSYCEH